MTKIAVIGAGFTGLALTWHLLNAFSTSTTIDLFDSKAIGQGTSGIAAGLLHPFAGAHSKLNRRGFEGVLATKELLHIASDAFGNSVTAQNKGILRLALTEKQVVDFQLCAQRFPEETEWLDATACQRKVPGCGDAPGLWIRNGLTVYSQLYLQGLWKACQEKGAKFHQKKIDSLSELQHYDLTLIATGAETLQISELTSLPLTLTKGQVLELSWPRDKLPLSYPLNSHVYLLMTESKRSCLVGATYERGINEAVTAIETAQKELLPKAIELYPSLKEASMMNCYAGMRAATPNHLPLLQQLSPRQWILTGMGSKGLLYHALYAKELVERLRS